MRSTSSAAATDGCWTGGRGVQTYRGWARCGVQGNHPKTPRTAPIFFPWFVQICPVGAALIPHFADCPVPVVEVAEHGGISLVSQIVRFAVVGVINTAVDRTVLNTLIAVSHRGRSGLLYSLFKAISFPVAVLNSYWLNSTWAFRQPVAQDEVTRVGRFLSVSVLGLAINVGTASWVATFPEPVRWLARYWPSVAALAGAVCGLAFNFAGYKYLVFRLGPTPSMGCSNTSHDSSDPFVSSIDDGLKYAPQRPLGTVERTLARDQAESVPPNETHQPPARVRWG
jgi:putative flippase GtrA